MHLHRCAVVLLAALAAPAVAYEPGGYIDRALQSIDAQRYGLARAYLDPVVIDPRLTRRQRSQVYFYRGYTFYAEGAYVSAAQDYARALEFAPDNTAVLAAIGELYANGLGVAHDPTQAFQLLLKAARGGHAGAKSYVGWAYLTGTGTAFDLDKARFWLSEAAAAGQVDATLQLARSYRAPYAAEPDPQQALALYQQAADAGSTDALVALGYMYLDDETGAADPARAAQYFAAAAERDAPIAQTVLATLYTTGSGVARDYARARHWFERAIAAQQPAAYAGLAHLYVNGLGVRADPERGTALLEQGAARGDVVAQLQLAAMQLRAPASQARTAEAIRWLRAAAAQDHPQAHNGLAWVLATSRYDALRDAATALAEARKATAQRRNATTLDTLAAALAESGDFEQAIATQQEAIAALDADQAALTSQFEARLHDYVKGVAWRE